MPALFRAEMVRAGSVSSTMSARRFKELGESSVVLALALPLSERASALLVAAGRRPRRRRPFLEVSGVGDDSREDKARKESSLFHGDFGFAQRNGEKIQSSNHSCYQLPKSRVHV